MRWRTAATVAAMAASIAAVGVSAAHPMRVRYDQPVRTPVVHRQSRPLSPRVRRPAPPTDVVLVADNVGGSGAGGSGKASVRCDFRCRAWRWARTQRGKWYAWGGTGPSTYDCSGLVYAAFRRFGHYFGRTTYEMLYGGHLYRVRRPKFGDLAFYGSGHVEFWAGRGHTFGAHQTGERISRVAYSAGWAPTGFYRVRRR